MTAITVTIWHNVAADAMLDGYRPGNPMVRVFTYQAAIGTPEEIAEEAFAICNDHPPHPYGRDLSRRYYERGLRSLSVGDIVAVGEAPLAVAKAGWDLVSGGLTEVRTREQGTVPLPIHAPGIGPEPVPEKRNHGE